MQDTSGADEWLGSVRCNHHPQRWPNAPCRTVAGHGNWPGAIGRPYRFCAGPSLPADVTLVPHGPGGAAFGPVPNVVPPCPRVAELLSDDDVDGRPHGPAPLHQLHGRSGVRRFVYLAQEEVEGERPEHLQKFSRNLGWLVA